jgi:hypothetical protein
MTARRLLPKVAALAAILGLAACATASLEDAAPRSAAEASREEPAAEPAGPVNQGQYPNLNIAPVRHDSQISTEGETADMEKLTQQRESLAAGSATTNDAALAESERLRQLGATHAEQALQEIEKQ